MKLIDQQTFEAGLLNRTIYSKLEDLANPSHRLVLTAHFSGPFNMVSADAQKRTISIDLGNTTAYATPAGASRFREEILEAMTRLRNGMIERLTLTRLGSCGRMDFLPGNVHDHKTHALWEAHDFHRLHQRLEECITGRVQHQGPQLYMWTPLSEEADVVMVVENNYDAAFIAASDMIENVPKEKRRFKGWGTAAYQLTTKRLGEAFILQFDE